MSILLLFSIILLIKRLQRCFPHVVNLACKAILKAITDMDFATENANEFVPDGPSATTFVDAIDRDPIATIRSVIRAVSSHLLL